MRKSIKKKSVSKRSKPRQKSVSKRSKPRQKSVSKHRQKSVSKRSKPRQKSVSKRSTKSIKMKSIKKSFKPNISKMSIGKMSDKYRSELSYNGYMLDVLKSALQKYIRRSDYKKAIYAGVELDLFYKMPNRGEGIRTNLIHRLMVIFMEDISMNESSTFTLWNFIDKEVFNMLSLRDMRHNISNQLEIDNIRKKEMTSLTNIIYALSTSVHARENSYYKYCLFVYPRSDIKTKQTLNEKFPYLKKIDAMLSIAFEPSFLPAEFNSSYLLTQFLGALEKQHEIVIYYAHLIAELDKSPVSIKCYRSSKPVYLIFYMMDVFFTHIKDKHFKKLVELGVKWYKELSPLKEDFLTWQTILLMWVKKTKYDHYEIDIPTNGIISLYDINLSGKEIEFDEWVYDMHTKIGKLRKKDTAYFALESSNVHNESKNVNKKYKHVYLYKKLLDDKYADYSDYVFDDEKEEKEKEKEEKKYNKKESEFGRFLVRAQLVTGNSKTDTYYVEDKKGKVLFVKGPFKKDEDFSLFLDIQEIKKQIGLPTLHYKIVYLIPDRFGNTPLGLRNRLDRKDFYPFIVCDALFDNKASDIPIRVHSSKLWPPTELIDFDQINSIKHFDFKNMKKDDNNMKEMLIKTLLFRYIFGLGDIAPRNFIIKDDLLFSIDEDIIDKDFDLDINLRRVKGLFEWVESYIYTHSDHIRQFLQSITSFELTDDMIRRLEDLIKKYEL